MSLPTSKQIRRANLAALAQHYKKRGRKRRDLAVDLDMSESFLSQLLSGSSNIGDALAAKLEDRIGLVRGAFDSPWASFAEISTSPTFAASERRPNVSEPSATYAAIPIMSTSNGDEASAQVFVPFYPRVRAAAGRGITNNDQGEPLQLAFRAASLRRRGIDTASAMVIYADGDSMEPLIGDGDTIMFDRSKTDIVDGKLYVIEVDHDALVKRIHRRPGGRLLVQSENPAYPAYEVTLESQGFRVLGRVVWGAGWLD
ncbi:MAG: LexA family transcriptional regulator [Candidatus Accumulibacter sp.]|nr:LexA family transcriptional regulator [Accumulibacter sp.]